MMRHTMGGGMGVVAIDKHGGIVMRYSGDGMYRGFVREDGKINVLVYEK